MKIKFYFRNLKFPEHENASKINFWEKSVEDFISPLLSEFLVIYFL
jgi:hypothetical protein